MLLGIQKSPDSIFENPGIRILTKSWDPARACSNPLSSTLWPPCGDFRGCCGGEPLDHKVESLMTIRFENFSGEQRQLDLIRILGNLGFLPRNSTEKGIKGANCQRHSSYQSFNGERVNLITSSQFPTLPTSL